MVDWFNGEECDNATFVNPGNHIIDANHVCRDCKIEESRCGDGWIDDLRGETCDPPYPGSPVEGEDPEAKYCNDQCFYTDAYPCVIGIQIYIYILQIYCLFFIKYACIYCKRYKSH